MKTILSSATDQAAPPQSRYLVVVIVMIMTWSLTLSILRFGSDIALVSLQWPYLSVICRKTPLNLSHLCTVVFVTGNENKLKEVRAILASGGRPIEIESRSLDSEESSFSSPKEI